MKDGNCSFFVRRKEGRLMRLQTFTEVIRRAGIECGLVHKYQRKSFFQIIRKKQVKFSCHKVKL